MTAVVDVDRRDPVADACASLIEGRPVFLTGRPDRAHQVLLAADTLTVSWTAWAVRATSGLLSAPLPADRADELDLAPMVPASRDAARAASTVSVDASEGVSTGISARDRTATLRLLADPTATRASFRRPGHILPLRAVRDGVLRRPGHPEAAVDLCLLAGLPQVAVLAELVGDDGALLRTDQVHDLGRDMQVPVLDVAELVTYRRAHPRPGQPNAVRVVRAAESSLVSRHGPVRLQAYRDTATGAEHVALVAQPLRPGALVSVHSECFAGETFGSVHCTCAGRLDAAMARIAADGGAVVYLRGHDGGHGGGLPAALHGAGSVDDREYGVAAAILADLGLHEVQLLDGNAAEVASLAHGGITVRSALFSHSV